MPRWRPASTHLPGNLFDGQWLGHADFLLRVDYPDRPSVWGPYH